MSSNVQIVILVNIMLQYSLINTSYFDSEANLLEILDSYILEREEYLGNAFRYLNAIEMSYNTTKNRADSDNVLKNTFYQYLAFKRVTVDWNNFISMLNKDTYIIEKVLKSLIEHNFGKYSDWLTQANDIKLIHYVRELINIRNKTKHLKLSNAFEEDAAKLRALLKKRIIRKMKRYKNSLNDFVESVNLAFEGSYLYWDTYKRLCRGEILQNQNKINLKCRYVHNNKPYLYIGPLKQEELNSDPQILMYHEVLFDSEIRQIKKMTLEQKMEISQSTETTYRVSKVAWLPENNVTKIYRRLEHMTNLNMRSAEKLQVSVYGLAGQYEPHYDNGLEKNCLTRSRIATILFYLNNVTKGGATVFPKLNLTAWPIKGSAIFWYNMKPDYEVDTRTLHAGCPLYYGTKWVMNSWVRIAYQEFRKPCVAAHRESFVY